MQVFQLIIHLSYPKYFFEKVLLSYPKQYTILYFYGEYMIKVIKAKTIITIFCIIVISLILSLGIVAVSEIGQSPYLPYTIVLDAGHGGRDNGCSGVNTNITEAEINLSIVLLLQDLLEDFGFKVVLTRSDANGLYEDNADNYKVSDMEKRIEIIDSANADFVVSIHQNSYPNSHAIGAQAFWQEGDINSENLAKSIQSMLVSQIPNARSEANYGDYYILKESKTHAVLIECGYLTNPEEEQLLTSEGYQNKLAYAITCGILKYFDMRDHISNN